MSDRKTNRPPGDYAVGYGKPPKSSQFGNRPQPLKGQQIQKPSKLGLTALLDSPAQVTRAGKTIRIHPLEATMISLGKQALQRKIRAIRAFLRECKKAGLLEPEPSERTSGVVVMPDLPVPISSYLWDAFGLPPWEPKVIAKVQAEYERDCAIIADLRTCHGKSDDER